MTREIKEYKRFLKSCMENDECDRERLAAQLYTRIGFYCHERLIHLIVTMSFALMFVASLLLLSVNYCFAALSLLLLVLLVPYIAHYYFLENSVQELYKIYYALAESRVDVQREQV